MKKSVLIAGIIISLALIGGGVFWYVKNQNRQPVNNPPITNNRQEQIATSTKENDTSNWQTYRNEEYGFGFKYPKGLVITSASKENDIILASEESGHWIYSIEIETNSDNLTLDRIIEKKLQVKNKIVNNIIIAGKSARRYSIKNFNDYGNAGVFFIYGNNIISVSGDDSTGNNKAEFEKLISTFTFTK